MEKFILGIVYILTALQWILGGLIYIWTLYIAYTISGLVAAIITFFLPFLGQAYWGYQAWRISDFDSPYLQWLIVLVVIAILKWLVSLVAIAIDSKSTSQ